PSGGSTFSTWSGQNSMVGTCQSPGTANPCGFSFTGSNPAITASFNAPPTVISTSPTSRGQGATNQNIMLNGTNFVSGAALAASFSLHGARATSTSVVTTFSASSSHTSLPGACQSPRNATASDPDCRSATRTSVVTVNAAPTVTSATPSSRGQGATNQN